MLTDIVCEEGRGVPVALDEHGEAGEDDNDKRDDHSEPGAVRLEGRLPRDVRVSVNALGLETGVHSDVGQVEHTPSEDTGESAHRLEPRERLERSARSDTWGQDVSPLK